MSAISSMTNTKRMLYLIADNIGKAMKTCIICLVWLVLEIILLIIFTNLFEPKRAVLRFLHKGQCNRCIDFEVQLMKALFFCDTFVGGKYGPYEEC